MNSWELSVKLVGNGFRIQWKDEVEEGILEEKEKVFEEDEDDEFGDVRAFVRMIQFQQEHFNALGNPYKMIVPAIDFKHGRKYECGNKDCLMCKNNES